MRTDVLNRLRAQTILLNEMPKEVLGLTRDEVLAEVERTRLRPLNLAAIDFLRRLAEHADLLAEAVRLAGKGRRRYEQTLRMEATIALEIDRIVDDTETANGHVFLALGVEQQYRHRELAVLRLLQEAERLGTASSGPALA